MQSSLEQVTHDALKLSPGDRATLARQLLLSLEDGEESEVEQAWEEEVERRVDDIRTGRAVGRPAEEVFSELRARYRR